ncbi:hypothetical protein M8C21_024737 [Ambrosia artemisiifolia]|uniref:Mitochondrial fission 1 protein n=1 Tax=Ambrosia artemisiifolia TaxID=4212 RepID=A0AAD5CLG4_AMBAR|nr:hypothetical protein M8C21_032504 [Ambrosia artemisiifolia]KAI7744258.1 hypothetical protein M8C21_024737 [Ambrosia artemisiifolia]
METINSSSATQEINHDNTSGSQSNWIGRRWTKVEVVTRKFFKPIRIVFASNDNKIQFIDDPSVIKDCQNQYNIALKESSDEDYIDKCYMRLTYTLVHSMEVDDVIHGIELLEEGLSKNDENNTNNNNNNEQIADKLYHLALGCYRCEEYNKSMELLNRCIEKSPNHTKASTLLKKVQVQIRRDEILCVGCAGFTCFAGLLGTFAATGHSDKHKYEKLTE